MGYHVNTTGKLLIGSLAAAAIAEVATGRDTGLRRRAGVLLLIWLGWVGLVLAGVYHLAALAWSALFG